MLLNAELKGRLGAEKEKQTQTVASLKWQLKYTQQMLCRIIYLILWHVQYMHIQTTTISFSSILTGMADHACLQLQYVHASYNTRQPRIKWVPLFLNKKLVTEKGNNDVDKQSLTSVSMTFKDKVTVLTCDSANMWQCAILCKFSYTYLWLFMCVSMSCVFFFIKDFIHWMSLPTNQNIELLLLKVICIFISVHEFIYFQLWTAADTEILTDWLSAWLSLSLSFINSSGSTKMLLTLLCIA